MTRQNQPVKPLDSVLVKPAGPDCNMACGYCFYSGKKKMFGSAKPLRMTDETLEILIRQILTQAGNRMSIVWQGGEPALMGLPFFQKAVDLMQRYGKGQIVGNGLQTNGLLIDEDWARFLSQYRFLVGLSIDGPQHVHDHFRKKANHKGTWQTVANKARLLLDVGVAVNAISVVNAYSVRFPEEIYEFLKNLGLYQMQFIPCVETDPTALGKAASFSVSAKALGRFWCALFDLWYADIQKGLPIGIRFFESLVVALSKQPPPECTLRAKCGDYLVVEHNGDVFACDFFVEPKWRLGNIAESDLLDMLNSRQQARFGRLKSELPAVCKRCKWLSICRGGCTKDRIKDPRDRGVSHFCESYRMLFDHAHRRLVAIARSLWTQHPPTDF